MVGLGILFCHQDGSITRTAGTIHESASVGLLFPKGDTEVLTLSRLSKVITDSLLSASNEHNLAEMVLYLI